MGKKQKQKPSKKVTRTNGSDLFDNPMVNEARAALSDEQKERYAAIGEEMYSSIDFEAAAPNQMPAPMAQALAYVVENIRCGLHPTDLDENEKALLADKFGEKWWEHFGYTEADLTEVVTLDPKLPDWQK